MLYKYIKQNCAPSWIYLRNYTGTYSQQNIKKKSCNGTLNNNRPLA